MKFTNLLLHVCLVSRDWAKLSIDILVHRVQFVDYLWIKNSLTRYLRLYLIIIICVHVLVLSVGEVPVIRGWLVIVVYLLFLLRVILSTPWV